MDEKEGQLSVRHTTSMAVAKATAAFVQISDKAERGNCVIKTDEILHCVKSVQIRSFSGPYFSVFGLNTGKYGPEKTPYLNTFHAVLSSALDIMLLVSMNHLLNTLSRERIKPALSRKLQSICDNINRVASFQGMTYQRR